MSFSNVFSKIIFQDSAEVIQLKEKISEAASAVSFLKSQITDESSLYFEFSLDLYDSYSYKLVYLKRMLVREQAFLIKLRKIFSKLIDRCDNFVQLEGAVKGHYMLRKRSIYFNKILKELQQALKEQYLHQEQVKYFKNLAKFNYLENKFNYNLLTIEECEDIHIQEFDEDDVYPQIKSAPKKRTFNYGNLFIGPQLPFVESCVVRSKHLLDRIHFIINNLKSFRLGFWNKPKYHFVSDMYNSLNNIYVPLSEDIEMAEFAYPEMERPSAQGNVEVSKNVEASNVVLTEARKDDVVISAPISRRWSEYVSTDVVGSYDIVTDRWMKIKDFTWTTQDSRWGELFRLKLPFDAVLNAPLDICDMPNLAPFRIHRYCRCDMEVKIQINSNKFQIGQLQCSWFYQPELDAQFHLRENVFSGSQAHHVLISASTSNEVTIDIPFKYHLPMVSTKQRSDILSPLSIGTLYVRVLNQLSVTSTGPTSCNGTVFIRFKNCEFTGMLKGSLDVPSTSATYEMDKVLDIGVNLLKGYLSENEDNPPQRTPPKFLVPTASHSWSLGTDLSEPLHSLRLSNRGRTMHPDVVESEQTVKSLVSKFGLISTITWSKNSKYGEILWQCSAAPILEIDCYSKIESKDAHILAAYYVPPVGVVSSMFNYWRGSIEFRFDIIATQFHTGRLIIGYVPGATSDSKITIAELFASPHMIFTLQENQSFTYQIPYISNKPFWSRNYVGNHKSSETIAPSRIYVAVINPLIPMESVVDSIYLNVYMRAGPDFEVSVPVQPCFGLAFNRNVLYSDTERIYAMPGYSPYYAGTWHNVGGGHYLVFRWGTASDEVAEFQQVFVVKMANDAEKRNDDPTKTFISYWYKFEDASQAPKYRANDGSIGIASQGLVVAGTTAKYSIFCPTMNENDAKLAAIAYYKHYNAIDEYDWLLPYLIKVSSTSSNEYISGNPPIIVNEVSAKTQTLMSASSSFEEIAIHESERTQALNVVSTTNTLRTTQGGRFLFGEDFMDLMDLCRRYQLYGSFVLDVTVLRQPGQACVNFPALAQGLDLQLGIPANIIEVANRCRDGHIPLIASGFRYGRGALRFRIVAPTGTIQAWVQHRPDRKLNTAVISTPVATDRAQSLFNHTYSYYIQDLNVNSILEFEVPFYQNSAFSLLQRPKFCRTDEAFYFSLGDISIGFNYSSADKKDIHKSTCCIYYSLGDDYQFSTFQGFPPMVLLDDIASPEMGLWDTVKNLRKNIKEEVTADVKDVVDEATQHLSDVAIDKLAQLKEAITSKGLGDIINTSAFRCIITNFVHISITSNIKHICVAIVSVFIEMGLLAQSSMAAAIDAVMNILNWIKVDNKSGNELTTPDTASIEVAEEAIHNMDDVSQGALAGLITLLWGSICSLLSLKAKPPKNLNQFSSFLTKDLTSCMKSANVFFVFLRNILSVLDHMKQYALGIVSPSYKISKELEESYPEIAGWMQEVLTLDDPCYRNTYQYTQLFKQRVDMAFLKGSIIYRNSIKTQHNPMIQSISKIFDRIKDLRDSSIRTGCDSYVRKECFTVWQYGKAGVGKSTVASTLIHAMLKSRGVNTSVPPIYNHNASSDFWDSCVGNPAMVVDDLFSVQSGTLFEKHLALLFSVHSPVVLCPPKAHLNDKGMTYNPEIFWINSNYDFLRFNGICEQAINRRRHVLFETIINPKKKANCYHCDNNIPIADCDPNLLSDYHHVLFKVKHSVLDPNSSYTIYTFPEFKDFIIDTYDRVMTKNEEMYEQRLKESMELFLEDDIAGDADMHEFTERIKQQHELQMQRIREQSIYSSVAKMVCKGKKSVLSFIDEIVSSVTAQQQNDVWQCTLDNFTLPDCEEFLGNIKNVSYRKLQRISHVFDGLSKTINRELNLNEKKEVYKLYKIFENSPTGCTTLVEFLELIICVCNFDDIRKHDMLISGRNMLISWYHGYLSRVSSRNQLSDMLAIENYRDVYYRYNQRMPYCLCKHMYLSYSPRRSKIENNRLISENGAFIDELCEEECSVECNNYTAHKTKCMWECNMFKYYWLSEFKSYHAHLFPSRGIFKDYHLRKLSPEFISRRIVTIPDENVFKEWCNKIREVSMNIVYSTYLGFKRVFTFIANIPIEFFLMVLCGICAVGYTCVAVKAISAGVESYRMDKQQGGWESHSYANVQQQNLNSMPRYATPESSPQQVDVAINRVMSNFFKITCVYNQCQLSCTGVILEKRRLLILRHYLEEYQAVLKFNPKFFAKFPFRAFVDNHGVEFDLFQCNFTYYNIKDKDGASSSNYVICELPLCFPESKSIIQFIATTKDHQRVFGDCCLVQNTGRISENIKCVRETNKLLVRGTATTTSTTLYDKYTYRLHARGMCGSILICSNLERPIIGMHVAGIDIGNERGVAELLCYETFKELPVKEQAYSSFIIPELTDVEFAKISINSMIYPLGCTDSQHTVFQSGETSYIPSKIQGCFEVRTEPNPLSKKDPRLPIGCSPLALGVENLGKPPLDFAENEIKEATWDLEHVLLNNVVPVRNTVGIVDLETVICGNSKIPHFESLEWSSSPGYPLRFERKASNVSGKKYLFDLTQTQDGYKLNGIDPRLQQLLAFDDSCRKRGIKPFTVFIDCLKDTTLPKEKCKIPGKTRIFSISPVQFTIHFKQYFLDFMASYQRARFNAEHAIGINVNSLEWTELSQILQSKGPKIICGDYKNFGPGLMKSVAAAAFGIIINWYEHHGDAKNNGYRRILASEVIDSYHLVANMIYTTPCGIPSGSPITTPLNDMCDSIYLRIGWRRTTNLGFREMHDHCRIITYGDDVCINITDEISEIFNAKTLQLAFEKNNIIFTDISKEGEIIPFRLIDTCQFLKCSFIPHPYRKGVYTAALDKVSVEGCANWILKRNDPNIATIQNCETVLELAHGWGEKYYSYVRDKMIKACNEVNLTFRAESWHMLDRRRYSLLAH